MYYYIFLLVIVCGTFSSSHSMSAEDAYVYQLTNEGREFLENENLTEFNQFLLQNLYQKNLNDAFLERILVNIISTLNPSAGLYLADQIDRRNPEALCIAGFLKYYDLPPYDPNASNSNDGVEAQELFHDANDKHFRRKGAMHPCACYMLGLFYKANQKKDPTYCTKASTYLMFAGVPVEEIHA